MPVKVKCSGCDKVLSVPDAARGKAVKCPACQTRIAIPAESAAAKPAAAKTEGAKSTAKPAAAKPKAKKPAKPADSEFALMSFDMKRAEDTAARVCPKCGFDMKYQDEEDNECPECGFDTSVGGMGVKAKKRAMKGQDPADFYPNLVSNGGKFLSKNISIAFRTIAYTLVALTIALGCAFLYLYISMWPPRMFLALCGTIAFLVIPGWMWVLDVEIVKLVLERKDKFKRLNFDFFMASAMGVATVAWCCAFVLPLMIVPGLIGFVIVRAMDGSPEIAFPACAAAALLPVISMLPVVMAHMAMPIPYKGWMVWAIVPIWARNFKASMYWFLWFIITNIPAIAGLTTVAVLYASTVQDIVTTMEKNAVINRAVFDAKENPNAKKKGQKAKDPVSTADLKEVDLTPLIVPVVVLALVLVANGFSSVFNMRTHAQFVYYNKIWLDLVDKRKEYKYVAKKVVDEDEEEKPKTLSQMITDSVAFFLIFTLLGGIGGMLYGSISGFGVLAGIVYGVYWGVSIAWFAVYVDNVKMAFQESAIWGLITIFGVYPIGFLVFIFRNFEERKSQLIRMIVGAVASVVVFCFVLVMILSGWVQFGAPEVPPLEPPAAEQESKVDEGKQENPGAAPAQPATPGDEN